jgi:hypothetical protein
MSAFKRRVLSKALGCPAVRAPQGRHGIDKHALDRDGRLASQRSKQVDECLISSVGEAGGREALKTVCSGNDKVLAFCLDDEASPASDGEQRSRRRVVVKR